MFMGHKRILTANGARTLNTELDSASIFINMKLFSRALNLILACGCFLLISRSANAYIDAGSGSYLLQIIFAGFLGGLYFVMSAFRNLKAAVVKRVGIRKGNDSSEHAG